MPDAMNLLDRTTAFIREQVLPIDDAHDGDVSAAGGDDLRLQLQQAAREFGVFAPHIPVEYGGHGLNMTERAPIFEAAGYSLFGPMALNLNAPDEGNAHLLFHACTPSQVEQYLVPLARGEVRSAFAMTEPSPGAGSDPSMLESRARREAGGWVVNGRKKFITGADGAGFFIIMARTSGEPGTSSGATMFLAPESSPGIEVVRHVGMADRSMIGGHCEIAFNDLFVPDDDVLGGVDEGFKFAQLRLGPARMTHVMRWLGAASRAHDTSLTYALGRQAFGGRLADQGMVHQMVADNVIDLAATRALLLEACRALDDGQGALEQTSIAKTFAAEALFRVVDRATQICGGMGVSTELPISKIAREIRPFRIYDGPSEVHRWSLARRAFRRAEAVATR